MAEKPEKKLQPVEKESVVSRYSIEEFTANAEALFSVRSEVLAGALHGKDHSELTIDEARRAIDQFLKKKVN